MVLFNNLCFAHRRFSFLTFLVKLVPHRIIFICFNIFIWFVFISYINSVLFFSLSLYFLANLLPCLFCAIPVIIFPLKIFFVKILENLFIMLLAQLTNCLYKLIPLIYFITNYLCFFPLRWEIKLTHLLIQLAK